MKLTGKVLSSRQWNLYRQITLAAKMEKLEKTVYSFLNAGIFTHVLVDLNGLRADYNVRLDRLGRIEAISSTYEAGPSGTVANWEYTESTRSQTIGDFSSNSENMVLVMSWLNSQLQHHNIMSSSGSDSGSTFSLVTPSLEFPDRISFREINLSKRISEDGDFFAITEVSNLAQGSQAQECIQQLEGESALRSPLQQHNIMSSSSSSVNSESTFSLVTPSLEFPDRISFRKMDLSEAGPSRTKRIRENSKSTSSKLIETENFGNQDDMELATPWQKGQLLGRGSYCSVYEAFSEDGDFFAIKEVSLLELGSQGQECIQQLEGEIAQLSQLQHQNIVQYRGITKDASNLYIFLELVSQGSLLKLYQRYQLRDSVVSLYTRQILDGLKFLHDKGFFHRDIKCANILVDTNGSVKLSDFGLTKVSKLNDIKAYKGTPFWMAPEVVNTKGNDEYGSPADIWSLGCTVLEMLTRKIPYSDLEPIQALVRIRKGMLPEIPDTLSQEARHFILNCLKVNPDERPTATKLLNHPFLRQPLLSSGSGDSVSPLIRRCNQKIYEGAEPLETIGGDTRYDSCLHVRFG
ncbi:mitogen-activated protein kinase kinase kinase 3 [Capsella rubella]|nr:mitogen-activated protein kinase kinase kinase 3 [Capsella rubella]